jgi:hypothetical protein
VKKRLDVVLVERGLAESRAQAQALVMAGQVPGYDKPGQQVAEDAALTVVRGPAYVSRGGDKLAHGLAPSHATLTNPTSAAASRAETQPRLCTRSCPDQSSFSTGWSNAAACSSLTSPLSKSPRHS